MSISECLEDYKNKHSKLTKKNLQVQNIILAKKEMFKKDFRHYDNSNEEKSKEEFKND